MKAKKVYEMIDPYASEETNAIDIDLSYKRRILIKWLDKYTDSYGYEFMDDGKVLILNDLVLEYPEITEIPENLIIGGNLYIEATNIKYLPDSLEMHGSLFADKSSLLTLPNIEWPQSVYINDTSIQSLPEHLTVGQSIDIQKSKFLKRLPDNMKVGLSVDLSDSAVEELGENITIENGLRLKGTAVKKLPHSLKLKGFLDIRDSYLKESDALFLNCKIYTKDP
jgi:hypothetical protein